VRLQPAAPFDTACGPGRPLGPGCYVGEPCVVILATQGQTWNEPQKGATRMIRYYARYALAALATIGFGRQVN